MEMDSRFDVTFAGGIHQKYILCQADGSAGTDVNDVRLFGVHLVDCLPDGREIFLNAKSHPLEDIGIDAHVVSAVKGDGNHVYFGFNSLPIFQDIICPYVDAPWDDAQELEIWGTEESFHLRDCI